MLGVVVVRFSEPVLVQGYVVVVHFYQYFPEQVSDVLEGLFFDSDLDSVPVQNVQFTLFLAIFNIENKSFRSNVGIYNQLNLQIEGNTSKNICVIAAAEREKSMPPICARKISRTLKVLLILNM